MKTGIVFEIKDGKATIMKTGGEFVLLPAKQSWRIGDVVRLEQNKSHKMKLIALAACFILLVFSGGFGTAVYLQQVSLVSMDVNPALEFGLNRFDRVISVTALNPEGKKIMEEMSLRNKTYTDALTLLLSNDSFNKYVAKTENITFTVLSKNIEQENLLLSYSENTAKQILESNHLSAQVESYAVDDQMVTDAHMHGVTAGKYIYLQQLQEAAPDIDINEYTHHSIGNIKEQIEHCQMIEGQMCKMAVEEDTINEKTEINETRHHGHGHHGHD